MERIGTVRVSQRLETCDKCGEATSLLIEFGRSRNAVTCACRCVRDRIEKGDKAREDAKKAENERRRMERAFGSRVPSGSFNYDDGRNNDAMRTCHAYATGFDEARGKAKNGLFLVGKPRVGKTFAAEAVAMHLHRMGLSILMDTAAGFVQRAQDREPGLMERVARCDLLVVDDLGASRGTSFGNEAVLSVIDARISARRPMIVTANVMPTSADINSQRLYGRVLERCTTVEFYDEKLL